MKTNNSSPASFLLTLKIADKSYGLDLNNVEFVASSSNLQKNITSQTAYIGDFQIKNKTIPVFDLNFAVNSIYAKRLFGTRLIISNVLLKNVEYKIALLSENVSKVVEIEREKISKGERFDYIDINSKIINIINIENLLGEVLLENV